MQNENRELKEKLSKQDSRVDALARICKGLEVQLREIVAKSENGNLSQLDVAAQWRNHAYKVRNINPFLSKITIVGYGKG